jgi:Rrf2 family protein
MMTLSQTTGYAIHALSWLDPCNGKVQLIRDVARLTAIPQPYLAKIINKLARCRIVASKRGHGGGICLMRPPKEITLLEVVEAIEGKDWIGHCLLGLDDCASRGICPTKIIWGSIRNLIEETLRNTTLADVIEHRKKTTTSPSDSLPAAVASPRRTQRQKGCECQQTVPLTSPPLAADSLNAPHPH